MVNRIALLGLASFSVLLAGCPDDLGQNLGGSTTAGVRAPTSLQASTRGDGREIFLSWEDQSANETGFRLEISPGPFGTSGSAGMVYQILPPGISTCSYSSAPHQLYYFRIFAVTDDMESEPSNEITILTPYALPSPQILGALGVSDGSTSFTLWWTLISEANGYQIDYSGDYGATWKNYPVFVAAGVDHAVISGFQRNMTYYVRVTALGPWGNSAPSHYLQVSIMP